MELIRGNAKDELMRLWHLELLADVPESLSYKPPELLPHYPKFNTIEDGDRGSTVVKVLCYKSEGRWFDPSWCH